MNKALPPNVFCLSNNEYIQATNMLKTANWMQSIKTNYGEFQNEKQESLAKLLSTFELLISEFRIFCEKPSLKYFKQGLISLDDKQLNPTVISSYSLILRAGVYVKHIHKSLSTIINDYLPSDAKVYIFYAKSGTLIFTMPSGLIIKYPITGSTQKRILEPYFIDDDISAYSISSRINAEPEHVIESFRHLSKAIEKRYPEIKKVFEFTGDSIKLASHIQIQPETGDASITSK